MAIFERAQLPAIAAVEQNCATGLTAEGKTPKHLVEEMVPLLDSRDVQYAVRISAAIHTHRLYVGTSTKLVSLHSISSIATVFQTRIAGVYTNMLVCPYLTKMPSMR